MVRLCSPQVLQIATRFTKSGYSSAIVKSPLRFHGLLRCRLHRLVLRCIGNQAQHFDCLGAGCAAGVGGQVGGQQLDHRQPAQPRQRRPGQPRNRVFPKNPVSQPWAGAQLAVSIPVWARVRGWFG